MHHHAFFYMIAALCAASLAGCGLSSKSAKSSDEPGTATEAAAATVQLGYLTRADDEADAALEVRTADGTYDVQAGLDASAFENQYVSFALTPHPCVDRNLICKGFQYAIDIKAAPSDQKDAAKCEAAAADYDGLRATLDAKPKICSEDGDCMFAPAREDDPCPSGFAVSRTSGGDVGELQGVNAKVWSYCQDTSVQCKMVLPSGARCDAATSQCVTTSD